VWTFIIIVLVVFFIRKHLAAGPWHDVTKGLPLKGVPVLTEYVSPSIGYHGFRVDTFSTRQDHFIEKENPDWVCEGDLGRGLGGKR
jgi:hypothetical protein